MICDKFVNSSPERKEDFKALRKKEKVKVKWRKHNLTFGKSKMNSMSEVEHVIDGVLIRTSNQFEIECAIMKQNYSRFTVTHNYPLHYKYL